MNAGYSKETQNKIEIITLLVYSLYGMSMSYIVYKYEWNTWIIVGVITSIVVMWMLLAIRFRTYVFRGALLGVLAHIIIAIYSFQVGSVRSVAITYVAVAILLGLLGIPKLMWISVVTYTILLILDILNFKDYLWNAAYTARVVIQYSSVYLVQFVVAYFITKQNQAHNELQGTIDELRMAQQSKDDFMANVSHELRTPINTICGMSEVILREDISRKLRDQIGDIQLAGRNLKGVVSDILDFSELQAEKIDVMEEVYNISSTINDVVNVALARRGDKRIEIIVDLDPQLPCGLLGDEQKIRRVITNFVNNAIKFTERGCIALEVTCRKESYGINLIVAVRDTGIGMDKASVEKLFTGFHQVDTKRDRREGGIGLGLAIAQALVTRMGGFITVESKLGKGSQFRMTLPQKVVDARPIVHLNEPEKVRVAAYINFEQFGMNEIRDEYAKSIVNMLTRLNVHCHLCRNLGELKRRISKEEFSHVFISVPEYYEDQEYFDLISQTQNVVLIMEVEQQYLNFNPRMLRLVKPFYVLPAVLIINGEKDMKVIAKTRSHEEKFIAPDAHILIVDDNPMNIRVVEGLLAPYHVRVTTAYSGMEALDLVKSENYDFIFMDHMMPEMDGIETFYHIREMSGEYYKNVPIVALTANAIGGMREHFLAVGFSDFVAKPVETSVLERVLRRILPSEKIVPLSDAMNEITQQAEEHKREAEKNQENSNDTPRIADLAVERGIAYCGTWENYIEVLKLHVKDAKENQRYIQELYDKQDWNNYVIQVHALKSSMKSIGADDLSELALGLEMAGKGKDYDYIHANHGAMMIAYEELFVKLCREPLLVCDECGQDIPAEEIDFDEFNRRVAVFEMAVYTFDGERIMEAYKNLENCKVSGKLIRNYTQGLQRKVEMCDYMSALATVLQAKEELENA